ncbi:hypothetical protein D3OALGA1CA_358 [Olavius algarvensis associated proteobacterium Delta 3]|nr:hypothetical protein D3OALGA1CA_358 [Olavius algarvensis associated proteobacterium Delta 3]CAB5100860.1 hypothetical protein D3OALGB2SA_1825 [Olavius algarvensis associated proteobacterium Delta 3]
MLLISWILNLVSCIPANRQTGKPANRQTGKQVSVFRFQEELRFQVSVFFDCPETRHPTPETTL